MHAKERFNLRGERREIVACKREEKISFVIGVIQELSVSFGNFETIVRFLGIRILSVCCRRLFLVFFL